MTALQEAMSQAGVHRKDFKPADRTRNPAVLIRELWEQEKSRKFLMHLIYSFGGNQPKTVPAWNKPDRYKCDLCKREILSLEEVDKVVKHWLTSGDVKAKLAMSPSQQLKSCFSNQSLALVSDNTKTRLCDDCVQELMLWARANISRYPELQKAALWLEKTHPANGTGTSSSTK